MTQSCRRWLGLIAFMLVMTGANSYFNSLEDSHVSAHR